MNSTFKVSAIKSTPVNQSGGRLGTKAIEKNAKSLKDKRPKEKTQTTTSKNIDKNTRRHMSTVKKNNMNKNKGKISLYMNGSKIKSAGCGCGGGKIAKAQSGIKTDPVMPTPDVSPKAPSLLQNKARVDAIRASDASKNYTMPAVDNPRNATSPNDKYAGTNLSRAGIAPLIYDTGKYSRFVKRGNTLNGLPSYSVDRQYKAKDRQGNIVSELFGKNKGLKGFYLGGNKYQR